MWTHKMEEEFNKVKVIFTNQIRLSPFNPDKAINILTDVANSAGVDFVFYQNLANSMPWKEVTIVNENSSTIKESQLHYSPIINIYTDCRALKGFLIEPLRDIKNKRI